MNSLERLLILAERRDANRADKMATVQLIGAVDTLLRTIDERVSAALDAVLHAPEFQALEASWRGLYHLVSGIRPNDATRVSLWSVTKDELAADLSSDPKGSQFFATVYTAEYGQFGGEPYGAAFFNFEVTHSSRDIALLRALSQVGAMAHVGMFLSPAPRLVGVDRWEDLRDAADVHEGPPFTAWLDLRNQEESRYIGLVLPRELARRSYDTPDSTLGYVETIDASGHGLVWASPIYSLARRFAGVFGRARQLGGIVGEDANSPPPMASPVSLAIGTARPSLEATITPRIERQLRPLGMMTFHQAGDRLVLASAHSLALPKHFGRSREGRDHTINHILGTRFPYLFIACRFAHYLKVLQREIIGRNTSATEIQQGLEEWLGRYIVNQDGANAEIRASHPLRAARITVSDVPGSPGQFESVLRLRPHIRYLGLQVALNVVWLSEPAIGPALASTEGVEA